MSKTKEPSQRQLRVGEEIRHILADVFLRGDFDTSKMPGISVTVTEVDVSPDLRHGIAYVSLLGTTVRLTDDTIVALLNGMVGEFNHAVARKLTMKFAPRLKFSTDTRFDYAARIDELLHKAKLAEAKE